MSLIFGYNTLYKLRPKKILDQPKVNVKLLVCVQKWVVLELWRKTRSDTQRSAEMFWLGSQNMIFNIFLSEWK